MPPPPKATQVRPLRLSAETLPPYSHAHTHTTLQAGGGLKCPVAAARGRPAMAVGAVEVSRPASGGFCVSAPQPWGQLGLPGLARWRAAPDSLAAPPPLPRPRCPAAAVAVSAWPPLSVKGGDGQALAKAVQEESGQLERMNEREARNGWGWGKPTSPHLQVSSAQVRCFGCLCHNLSSAHSS